MAKKKLTDAKIRKYVAGKAQCCPRCGDVSVDGGSFDMNGNEVCQEIYCIACGLRWYDHYKLNRIEVISED
jgi:transcription elongation factor Elf1